MAKCDEKQLAYLAGYIDADGAIGIYKTQDKRQFRVEVQVTSVKPESIFLFKKLFDGCVYTHKVKGNNRRDTWHWIIADKQAQKFLEIIEPYLILKKMQARLCLELRKTPVLTRGNSINNEKNLSILSHRQELRDRCSALNIRGKNGYKNE